MRRRDLQDGQVVERRDPVHGPRDEVERIPWGDPLRVEDRLPRLAELEPAPPGLDVPALVLLLVELEAERVARADEEGLPQIELRVGPDELPAPRLLDSARLGGPAVETFEVRRVDAHAVVRRRGRQSGCSVMNSSARRRSFGVLTVSQTPSCR